MKKPILLSVTLFILLLSAAQSAPFGTGITYQGRLNDGGNPANGNYDFQFLLFDAAEGGSQVPFVMVSPNVGVTNGLFTTGFDFGTNVFNGTLYWLEVGVRPAGNGGSFTFLTPRQPLTPAPNALFSANAALATTATTASGVAASAVSPAQLNTPGAPANGQVLAYNGTTLVWTNAATVAAAWTLNGNAGTTAGADFVGTTDNQPLEIKVNGQRAFRLEPNTNGAPNVIGGSPNNAVDSGVVGATIAGGGATNYFGFSYTNRVGADVGTISGGARNTIQVGGGASTIGGGYFNTIEDSAFHSTIGGGSENTIQTYAFQSTIGGGYQNAIQTNAFNSIIGGGYQNTILSDAHYTTIGGGYRNTIQTNASGSTIVGGDSNTIQTGAGYATIGGGILNVIQTNAQFASIGGGLQNTIGVSASNSTVGGGQGNAIATNATYSTVSGGGSNSVEDSAYVSTISGGGSNTIQTNAFHATIGGGASNWILNNAAAAIIAGGDGNVIGTNAVGAAIGGGSNQAGGMYSTVPGGWRNNAFGHYSMASGAGAHAVHSNSFVWADCLLTTTNIHGLDLTIPLPFLSTTTNEFAARATGGVRFVSAVDSNGVPVAGVNLPAGSGSWSSLSDRNAKTNFARVNPRQLLERLVQLPIQTWNYKSQSDSVRHIGPVAQDFAVAFKVGEDDRHIAAVDADGVALAAIQGLNQKLTEELKQKQTEITELKQRLDRLEAFLNSNNGGAK